MSGTESLSKEGEEPFVSQFFEERIVIESFFVNFDSHPDFQLRR